MRLPILTLCAALVAAPLAASELVGHRAIYKLTLETARGDVIGATGTMGYEVIDACDAWAVRQRLAINITSRDGSDVDLAADYTTWESKDGLRLRFRMRQSTDDMLVTDLAGTAKLDSVGGEGEATYSVPADTVKKLPAGTMFPTGHTELILESAKAGKRFLAVPLFDGTNAEGAQDSTVAITGWNAPATMQWPELSTLPSTRVRIAFFDREGSKQQPDYEVGMRYFANGIADTLSMDFGDYVLSGKLSELQVTKPNC